MRIKGIVRKIVGESNAGKLDYFLYPDLLYGWESAFNGQKYRQLIFSELHYNVSFSAIVETGTYRGATTSYFLTTGLPVFTVESNKRYFSYSKARFFHNRKNIHLYKSDSRSFLKMLTKDSQFQDEHVFFYLDAHWENDLPLREELKIIFSTWKKPVVMVDDFDVPNSNYQYDDYGEGKVLNLEYVKPLVEENDLMIYFPKTPASKETGEKRGCVVLTRRELVNIFDENINTLSRYTINI